MTLERPLRVLIVAAAGLGLALQYQVVAELLAARGLGSAAVIWKLTSYFTILTNLLLLLGHTIALVAPSSRAGTLSGSPAAQGALLLYIMVVKVVYVAFLARLWNPEGMQWWADLLLHHVTPLLQFGFWLACVPKARLPWKLAVVWLTWPALYLICTLARGDAPYPFLDLHQLGLPRLVLSCAAMGAAFVAGSLAIIAGSRYFGRHRQT